MYRVLSNLNTIRVYQVSYNNSIYKKGKVLYMSQPIEDFNFNSLFGLDPINQPQPTAKEQPEQGYLTEPDLEPDPEIEPQDSKNDFFGLDTTLQHQVLNSVDPNSVETPTDFVDVTDEDDEISFEQEGDEFSNRYTELNEDLLGVKQGIPEGYPRIEFTIDDSVPMTNRELKSLQHFLLGYDYVERIEEDNLIRVLMNIRTLSNNKSSYIGLISPKSLKTVLNNMKHHSTEAYFDSNTKLEGDDIFALYVPHL